MSKATSLYDRELTNDEKFEQRQSLSEKDWKRQKKLEREREFLILTLMALAEDPGLSAMARETCNKALDRAIAEVKKYD